MATERGALGLGSGIGLVAGNMIGTGVLLSAGFMAAQLTPAQILLCWVVGGVMAMAGARAYAALAALIPRSGGEYRYLSDLLHPALGSLAGWTSLLVGFSAAVAVTTATLGPYAGTLAPRLDLTVAGVAVIVATTLFHALDLGVSRVVQDLLFVVKLVLVVGFVVLGLTRGEHTWPTWQPANPPGEGAPDGVLAAFMGHLVWVTYAYTGWNSAAYAAGEFRDPRRDVPRAMLLGCAVVAVLYVAVNWVFVANLGQADFVAFKSMSESGRITLGHFVTSKLLGDTGGRIMSAFVLLALLSTISSMTYVGPRVYAAMAEDGYLPRAFAARAGKPPMLSVLLQGALAITLFLTHSFGVLMKNVGAILTLTSGLCALGLFRVAIDRRRFARLERPSPVALAAAGTYLLVSTFMLWFAVRDNPSIVVWMLAVAAITTVAYAITRVTRRT